MMTIPTPAGAICAIREHRALLIGSFVALLAMALLSNARASSILATINDEEKSGFPNGDHQQQTVNLIYNYPLPPAHAPCIGCALTPTGFTGTTDYTAANTADFNDFTSHLTNGVDELLNVGEQYYTSSGEPRTGGYAGSYESSWFGLPSDLQGDTIDFIRREIFTNTVTPTNIMPGQPGPELEADVVVRWEIWGTGPVVSPVLEPASLTLLCVGIVVTGIGAVRRRTRQIS
jgi:hypothetical protein